MSAFSALRSVASAPSTEAWAEALLAAIVSALVVLVWPEPEPDPPLEPEPDPPLERVLPDLVCVCVVRVGVERVGVGEMWVVVGGTGVVAVVVGVVAVVAVRVVVVAAGWKVTNSVDSWTF